MKNAVVVLAVLSIFALGVGACGEIRGASQEEVAAAEGAGLERVSFRSSDIYCMGCVATIKATLEDLGVTAVSADLESKTMTGYYDPSRLTPEAIRSAIENVGYGVDNLQTGEAAGS